jgi:hypothetical protein
MKKKILSKWFVVMVVAVMFVAACTPATAPETGQPVVVGEVKAEPPTKGPSHFVCTQGGLKVVDVQTFHGVNVEKVSFNSSYVFFAWVWDDTSGHHQLERVDSLSCGESTPLG